MSIATFEDVEAEFDAFDDWDDRYRLLIDLGRALRFVEERTATLVAQLDAATASLEESARATSAPSRGQQ